MESERLAPSFGDLVQSMIWLEVTPYFASTGLPMIAFPVRSGPGLYRKQIVSGNRPRISSRNWMWVMSSRLMIAPAHTPF